LLGCSYFEFCWKCSQIFEFKVLSPVVDTGHQFMTGVKDTGGKFIAGVVDTGDKLHDDYPH